MKKFGIVALLLVAGLALQAGQVNWTASGIRDPDNGTTITSTDMLYVELYYAGAALSQNDATWETTFGSGGTLVAGAVGNVSAAVSGAGRVYGSEEGDVGWEVLTDLQATAIQDENGYGSFYMKVYYTATGTASPTTYQRVGVTHYKTYLLENVETSNIDVTFAAVSSQSHIQWAPAIPEPTTMALFGLGGLALVLRRKMRKDA